MILLLANILLNLQIFATLRTKGDESTNEPLSPLNVVWVSTQDFPWQWALHELWKLCWFGSVCHWEPGTGAISNHL